MRSDLLSKRIFLAGCLGLPWLWIVHVMYNKDLESSGTDEETVSDNSNQGLIDADERKLALKGLFRAATLAILFLTLLI